MSFVNQNNNTVISAKGLIKRFGSLTAVDNINLDLQENEFFAMLGPSGCGKTTLLRMLAGFETPTEGSVFLDGQDIIHLRPNKRPINLMFQSYALFPHMTVWNNIAYGLEMEKLDKAEIAKRAGEVIEMAHLEEFKNRKPDQLSGGQRQRVALARALVKRPRVLLLDEPLGALDKKLRAQMQLELKRLQHEVGITFVVVTHDQEEALVMADRIALLHDGKIAQLDSPHMLYENPKSKFVADFIGDMNFMEGVVVGDQIKLDSQKVVDAAIPEGLVSGNRTTLAIRPERLNLSYSEPAEGLCALKGKITDVAYHGQDLNVHLDINGVDNKTLVRVSAASEEAKNITMGQEVWCNWKPDDVRILTE